MGNIHNIIIYMMIFLALFLTIGLTIKLTLFPEPMPTPEYSTYCLDYAQDICRYLKELFYEDETAETYKECVDRLIRACIEQKHENPSALKLAGGNSENR